MAQQAGGVRAVLRACAGGERAGPTHLARRSDLAKVLKSERRTASTVLIQGAEDVGEARIVAKEAPGGENAEELAAG